jgi:hypothetical protein
VPRQMRPASQPLASTLDPSPRLTFSWRPGNGEPHRPQMDCWPGGSCKNGRPLRSAHFAYRLQRDFRLGKRGSQFEIPRQAANHLCHVLAPEKTVRLCLAIPARAGQGRSKRWT